jgi:hypothetical protein
MNPTQDTIDLVKGALNTPDDRIAKTTSTSTGLVAYDLQVPAKNLYPVVTPIRNALPRVGGGTSTASNWRQVFGDPVREVLLLPIIAEIGKREHDDRQPRRS